jgi:hypothetical protein
MEMEEQTSKFAVEETKCLELEAAHAELQATLDAKKERQPAVYATRLFVTLLHGLRRIEHDGTNFRTNCEDIFEGLGLEIPNFAALAPGLEIPNVSSEVLERVPLSIVDSWLVHEMKVMSLPSKIKTTKMLERFNEWAGSNVDEHQPPLMMAFKKALDPYQLSGLFWKHTKTGNVYYPSASALRDTFRRENKIEAEADLLKDSE